MSAFGRRKARLARWFGVSSLALGVIGLVQEACAPAANAAPPSKPISLRFEPNRGQFEEAVRFLARSQGFGLYLTADGATLARSGPDNTTDVIAMRLVGAVPREPVAAEQLPGRTNYFVGSDPERWKSDVESYARVTSHDARPGVDLTFYGNEARELEYDLTLAPGGDVTQVMLDFQGVRAIELDARGGALLWLPSGATLRQKPPLAYQHDRQGRRELVASRYVLRGPHRLGFVVGVHDPKRALVIDPTLSYSSLIGAQSFDQLNAVATDNAGNTYAVGYTTAGLFPAASPLQSTYKGGAADAVICKLDPSGSSYVYATYLGGSSTDQAYAVTADQAGNAYVTGVTYSTNFPLQNALQTTGGGSAADGFVVKLNAAGSALSYSTYLGGSGDEFPGGIAVDATTGSATIVGQTWSTNFPLSAPLQAAFGGESDAFVTRLSSAGALEKSTFLGGNHADYATAVASVASGEVFVAGWTKSTNFPVLGAYQSNFGGGSDAFLTRLDANGSAIVSSTYLGGSGTDIANGVAIQAGSAVVAGSTTSSDFPTLAASQGALATAGVTDGFVTHFNGSANALLYSTYFGGSGEDSVAAVAADADNAYVVGKTTSTNLPLRDPIRASISTGDTDAFMAAYTPSGFASYATYIGGSQADSATGAAVRAGRELHVVGNTSSANFPIVAAPAGYDTFRGNQDGFILRSPVVGTRIAASATTSLALALLGALLLALGCIAPRRNDDATAA